MQDKKKQTSTNRPVDLITQAGAGQELPLIVGRMSHTALMDRIRAHLITSSQMPRSGRDFFKNKLFRHSRS